MPDIFFDYFLVMCKKITKYNYEEVGKTLEKSV